MILNEDSAPKVLSALQLNKYKLLSQKDQLEILLRKKARLDTEIKILQKSIKNRIKTTNVSVRASLQIENSRKLTTAEFEEISGQFPDLASLVLEYDRVEDDIKNLLEAFSDEVLT